MFEQAILDDRRAVRPWAVLLSATGQTAVLGSVVLLTMIHTEILPIAIGRPGILVAPMGGQPKPARVQATRLGRAVAIRPGALVFHQPGRISALPVLLDGETAPAVGASDGPPSEGIPGGLAMGCANCIDTPVVIAQLPPATNARPVEHVVKPAGPVPVGGRVQAAKLLSQIKPAYPPLARSARVSGTVRLEAIIARDGTIRNLRSISGHPLLTQAALDAVRTWRYEPTLLNGEPVEVVTQIEVHFTLS